MKNSLNAGFIVLLFVILGCSCPRLNKTDTPSSTPVASNTATVPTTTTSPGSMSNAGVSMAKYNLIKNNMTKSEVEKIIGSAGEEVSSSSGGGYTFSSFKWTGDNFATIIISFKNDKVMSKSQFGLK
jgi:hypothetical protein